ncbi:tyrosine-type recombinase/integrase [Halocola ammonii]
MNFDDFLDYLESEKRYSPHTLDAYRRDLIQFKDYIEVFYSDIKLEEVSHQIIRSWMALMMEEGLSARSVNRKISTLRSFYRYLQLHDLIDVNPMTKVTGPKMNKKLPVFVEQKSMDKLFSSDLFEDDFSGVRDELMILLFYETGVRLSELINLKSSNVNFSQNQIKVLGKRNKERIIPVLPATTRLITEYLELKEGLQTSVNHSVLLVSDSGQKLSQKLVYGKVNFYLSHVTTLKKKSPHVLRHTFATHMLNNGAKLNSIKELLGHASLAATQVYTHNTIEQLKNIHKQTHPKG